MTSNIHEVFTVGERVRIEASTTSGDIIVSPGEPGVVDIRIEDGLGNFMVEQSGDLILIKPNRSGFFSRFASADIHLAVPGSAELALHCTSGDVLVNTPVREVEVSSASGDVRIDDVARSVKVRSASGDVWVGGVGEQLTVTTASGTVRAGDVGRDFTATSGSGDVYVDRVGETASVKAASGDISVHRFDGTELSVKTLSGDLRIGIPPRRLLDVDLQTLSGELRNRLPEGDGSDPERSVSLRLTTVSGDVTLRGA